jgi:hypothetical protein
MTRCVTGKSPEEFRVMMSHQFETPNCGKARLNPSLAIRNLPNKNLLYDEGHLSEQSCS